MDLSQGERHHAHARDRGDSGNDPPAAAHANGITAYVKHRELALVSASVQMLRNTIIVPSNRVRGDLSREDRCDARTVRAAVGHAADGGRATRRRICRECLGGPPCGRARLGFRLFEVLPGRETQAPGCVGVLAAARGRPAAGRGSWVAALPSIVVRRGDRARPPGATGSILVRRTSGRLRLFCIAFASVERAASCRFCWLGSASLATCGNDVASRLPAQLSRRLVGGVKPDLTTRPEWPCPVSSRRLPLSSPLFFHTYTSPSPRCRAPGPPS